MYPEVKVSAFLTPAKRVFLLNKLAEEIERVDIPMLPHLMCINALSPLLATWSSCTGHNVGDPYRTPAGNTLLKKTRTPGHVAIAIAEELHHVLNVNSLDRLHHSGVHAVNFEYWCAPDKLKPTVSLWFRWRDRKDFESAILGVEKFLCSLAIPNTDPVELSN